MGLVPLCGGELRGPYGWRGGGEGQRAYLVSNLCTGVASSCGSNGPRERPEAERGVLMWVRGGSWLSPMWHPPRRRPRRRWRLPLHPPLPGGACGLCWFPAAAASPRSQAGSGAWGRPIASDWPALPHSPAAPNPAWLAAVPACAPAAGRVHSRLGHHHKVSCCGGRRVVWGWLWPGSGFVGVGAWVLGCLPT